MKSIFTSNLFLLLCLSAIILQSCSKSPATRTYTITTPVYKALTEVVADVKNSSAEGISTPGKMFVIGHYIFLNEVDKGVHIIDNKNPSRPVNKYFIKTPGNMDVAVKGNILYAGL